MAITGKAFEERFKKDFKKSFPDGMILRLYDTTMGYKSIANVCDFIGYVYPNIYLLECKTHKGASLPFDKVTQYDKLVKFAGIEGVRAGVVLYLYDKDVVYYIPVKTIQKMKEDGKKSVGLKAVEEGYRIIEIPSQKLRVFMDLDFTILRELQDGD